MKAVEFINHIKEECKQKKVKLFLGRGRMIKYPDGNFKVPGYFSTNPNALYCATKNKYFLETLVHESCHLDQWVAGDKLCAISDDKEDDAIFDKWMSGKKYPKRKMVNAINRIQTIELNTEKRAVEKIKNMNLPIDIKKYIKQSNTYIFLYTFLKDKQKWPDIEPWDIKELMNIMPSAFLKDYSKLSNRQRELFEMCYKNK